MTTREKLLELFESHKGCYFSGEEIARELCVSRAAVWKAVKSLRNEGYEIDAVTNKGYCLSTGTDILSSFGIQKYLSPACQDMEFVVLPTADSTNSLVREKANQGALEGYTLISNEQTKGRGRYGRQFFSPEESGVYLSVLLRPSACSASLALKLTTMAAVAMCEAIEEVSGETAQIKWVNDIYVNGKKVCGILTEASLDLESGMLEYAVLGVGVNVYLPQGGFPEELLQVAGAIFDSTREDAKNQLVAAFANHFMEYYRSDNSDYIEKYRRRNLVIGKTVIFRGNQQERSVTVRGIDEQCRLIVQDEKGENSHLSYGEVEFTG